MDFIDRLIRLITKPECENHFNLLMLDIQNIAKEPDQIPPIAKLYYGHWAG